MTYDQLIDVTCDYYSYFGPEGKLEKEAFIKRLGDHSRDIDSLVQMIDVTISNYRSNGSLPTDKNELNRSAALTAVALVITYQGMPPLLITPQKYVDFIDEATEYVNDSSREDMGEIFCYAEDKTATLKNLKRAAEMLAIYWYGSPRMVMDGFDAVVSEPRRSITRASDYHTKCLEDAKIRQWIKKLSQENEWPFSEGDLSLDNDALFRKLLVPLTKTITDDAGRYESHVERPELDMDEEKINHLKYLATAAITIARLPFNHSRNKDSSKERIELACKMLSVYSGGKNACSNEFPARAVSGELYQHSIKVLVDGATRLLERRRLSVQDGAKKPSIQ